VVGMFWKAHISYDCSYECDVFAICKNFPLLSSELHSSNFDLEVRNGSSPSPYSAAAFLDELKYNYSVYVQYYPVFFGTRQNVDFELGNPSIRFEIEHLRRMKYYYSIP
jgi:hypothetical protein